MVIKPIGNNVIIMENENMSMGNIMFYGGIIGIIISILAILICLRIFPREKKKLLKNLGDE